MAEMIVRNVLELVVALVCFLVTKYVVPFIKSKVDTNKLLLATKWASVFVEFAEMAVKGENLGEDRLVMVTGLLSKKLNDLNIKISDEEMNAIIEKCVFNMNNNKKE